MARTDRRDVWRLRNKDWKAVLRRLEKVSATQEDGGRRREDLERKASGESHNN